MYICVHINMYTSAPTITVDSITIKAVLLLLLFQIETKIQSPGWWRRPE